MIFLSHASEDAGIAARLFELLEAERLNPWLDKKKILPGQDWEAQIWHAATRAEFFCLLLSPRSTNKRGFFRKEIRFALDKWREKLPDDVYLIPCRIEDADIPTEIRHLQYCELNTEDDFANLVSLIKKQSQRSADYDLVSKIEDFEVKTIIKETDGLDLSIEFPSFRDPHLESINQRVNELVSSLTEMGTKLDSMPYGNSPKSYLECGFRVYRGSTNIVSILFSGHWYGSGAAHPNHLSRSINFSRSRQRLLSLNEIFLDAYRALRTISAVCRFELLAQNALDDGISEDAIGDWIGRGTDQNWDNFDCWILDSGVLRIFFDPYTVGPYAWGPRTVTVPLDNLQDQLSSEIGKVD